MARITHPRPDLGTQTFIGITFHDGVADFDLDGRPHMRESLVQHGFAIDDGPELEAQTVEELRATAKQKGVSVPARAKKEQIVETIADAQAEDDAKLIEPQITVGSIVRLTPDAIALIGGDEDSRARVLDLEGEPAEKALVEWITPSEPPETVISLSLVTLAPAEA